jgi:hypothetical protein
MAAVKLSKSATSIQMASNVAVIVEFRGLIMDSMPTKRNVPFAAMFMEQMDQICSKGAAQSARKEHRGSGIGRTPKNNGFELSEKKTEWLPIMPKRKRKLTAAEKAEKKRRRKEYMTIIINGKQKRVKRAPTIDGMDMDEFVRRNADPIWLHQNEMWEYMIDEDES